MRGNSHDPSCRDRVFELMGGRGIDFIMIDGVHSRAGETADFEPDHPLLAPGGLLTLHDSVRNSADPSIDVHRFWLEVSARCRVEEIIEQPDQQNFGIGLVHAPGSARAGPDPWERKGRREDPPDRGSSPAFAHCRPGAGAPQICSIGAISRRTKAVRASASQASASAGRR